MKHKPALSVEELVAYLKRTQLFTVLVEGTSDAFVYRSLESRLTAGDVLACNGREALLKVFARRSEFPGVKVVFVADRDMWYFTGIPVQFAEGILFTVGYCIENDLYLGSIFEGLLDLNERRAFESLLDQLSIWFAAEVEKYRASGTSQCGAHVNRVCPRDTLCERYKEEVGFREPSQELVQLIRRDYECALRGKSLFEALLRFLSATSRESKFSKNNLMELGSKMCNKRIDVLVTAINAGFDQRE